VTKAQIVAELRKTNSDLLNDRRLRIA